MYPKRCKHCRKLLQPNMYGHYERFCNRRCFNDWAANLKKRADDERRRYVITTSNKRRMKAKSVAKRRRNRKNNR